MPRKRANTLRGTANLAKEDYRAHKWDAKRAREYSIPIDDETLAAIDENNTDFGYRWENGRQMTAKSNLLKAREHLQQHAGEYFEIALIDAHLDGVKINVEQPLEIGQKIEVHTSDHQ